MKYKIIDQKCTEPKYREDFMTTCEILYKGGADFEDNITKYIHSQANESKQSYGARLTNTSYEGHLSSIISTLLKFLLENKINIIKAETEEADEVLNEISEHINNTMMPICEDLLLHGSSWCALELPILKDDKISVYDLEQLDIPKLYKLDIKSVINHRMEKGKLVEIIIKNSEYVDKSLLRENNMMFDIFTYWKIEDGLAKCETYISEQYKTDDPTSVQYYDLYGRGNNQNLEFVKKAGRMKLNNTDVKLVDSFTVAKDCIPIFCFKSTSDLNIGSKVVPMVVEHINRKSKFLISEERSLNPIPIISSDGMSGFNVADINTGKSPADFYIEKGFFTIGENDKCSFLEANGVNFSNSEKSIDNLIDRMYKISFLGSFTASNATTAIGTESGKAKKEDNKQLNIVISSLATQLKGYLCEIVEYILEIMNYKIDNFYISGLDQTSDDTTDLDNIVKELEVIQKMNLAEHVPTFYKYWLVKFANVAMSKSIEPILLQTIANEIEKADFKPKPIPGNKLNENGIKVE